METNFEKETKSKIWKNKKQLAVLIVFIIACITACTTIGVEIATSINNKKDVKSSYFVKKGDGGKSYLAETPDENQSEAITVIKTVDRGNNANIYEGQIIQYKITVKNNTNEDIHNLTVKDEIPDEVVFAREVTSRGYSNGWEEDENVNSYEYSIETLKAKEEKTNSYFVRVKKVDENIDKKIGTKALTTIENDNNQYHSNMTKNTIKSSKLQIDLTMTNNRVTTFSKGGQINYFAKIKNISSESLNNITIKDLLPQGVTYESSGFLQYDEGYFEDLNNPIINENFNTETNTVIWDLGNIASQEEKGIFLKVNLNSIEELKTLINIENNMIANIGEEEYYSNIIDIEQLGKVDIEIEKSSDLQDTYLYEDDEFEYIINLKNNTNVSLSNIELTDVLPKGITGVKAIVESNITPNYDEEDKGEDSYEEEIVVGDIEEEENINEYSDYETDGDEIIQSQEDAGEEGTEDDSYEEDNNSGDNNINQSEKSIKDRRVMISTSLNPGEIIKVRLLVYANKIEEGEELEIINSATVKGEHIQEKTSNEVRNIIKKKNEEEEFETVSNELVYIEDPNYEDNNTGDDNNNTNKEEQNNTKESNKGNNGTTSKEDKEESKKETKKDNFNLKIDKYINKVLVKDPNGTKVTEYNDTKLAKVEIPAKTINSSNITVEYKIVITNVSDVAGYVDEIIDNMPNSLKFNKNNNDGWSSNGNKIINKQFAGILIKPGESKTLTLILNKTMNENSTGTLTNTAQISKSFSKNEHDEINSQDNTSSADLIIGIKTGKVVLYTILITSIIVILGSGIYLIKKKVL